VYCQVEVSATSLSLLQSSPTVCSASSVCCRNLVNEEALSRGGGGLSRQKQNEVVISLQ
jgi:hypothetical protein